MKTLHAAVLATRRVPGLAALYGGIYRGGTALSAASFGRLAGVESVLLHRGLARGRLDPGVSDVDLIIVRRPLADAEEPAWLAALAGRWSALRRGFPPLGDLWVGTPDESALYLRRGGLRAWEDSPHWRALRGNLPMRPAYAGSPLKRAVLDPWVWAFVSYMDLSRRVWADGPDLPAKRDADLRKMYRETRRLCVAVMSGEPPHAREAPLTGPDPERAEPRVLWLAAAVLLAEASLTALQRCPTAATAVPTYAPAPGLETLRAAAGALQIVSHPPYHIAAILPDLTDGPRFIHAASVLAASGLAGAPMVLTASSWALALQSSYLGMPLGRLGGATAAGQPSAGLFTAWTPTATGAAVAVPLLAPALRREVYLESTTWMLIWWRALWAAPGFSNRFVLHHLYTRALGLRLALAGHEVPFDDWEALLDAASTLAGEQETVETLRRWVHEEPAVCVDNLPRSALAAEHAVHLSGLMSRLRGAVEAS